MSDPEFDYLWDPRAKPAEAIRAMEQQLHGYSAQARGLSCKAPTPAQAVAMRPRRRWPWLAAAAAVLLTVLAPVYRWSWPAQAAWPLVLTTAQHTESRQLAPGQTLSLQNDQHARLQIARIGRIELAPGSQLQLLETASGRHRVELKQGQMQARVWAPPGYFGVQGGGALILDLGCEFELSVSPDDSGRLQVSSGWVAFERAGRETLVPAGYALDFNGSSNSTPVRVHASDALRTALAALDQALQLRGDPPGARSKDLDALAAAVAEHAANDDLHSLLSLLTRYPMLAQTALYPRLANALGTAADDSQHRRDWARGEVAAINRWWQLLPRPPKAWWRHWRDAF